MTAARGNFRAFAIVGALVQRGALDPMSVATWAEFFAGVQSKTSPPDIREAINEGLRDFANSIRSMATKPPGSGEMRQ